MIKWKPLINKLQIAYITYPQQCPWLLFFELKGEKSMSKVKDYQVQKNAIWHLEVNLQMIT